MACIQTISMGNSSQEKSNRKVSFKIFPRGTKALPNNAFQTYQSLLTALAVRECETSRKTRYIELKRH